MSIPKTIPPTPLGGYHLDATALGVPFAVAPAWLAALAAHRGALSPCSNTGRTLALAPNAPAFCDYLTFTLRGLKAVLSRVRRDVPAPDGLEDLRAILFDRCTDEFTTKGEQRGAAILHEAIAVDCTGHAAVASISGRRAELGMVAIARTLITACAPALLVGDLTRRGLNGYADHCKITTHLGENCGSIAVGGNRDTVHVILTGQACQRVDMSALADALEGFDYKLGRIDAAFDDFSGAYGTAGDAAIKYDDGGFTPARGARSNKVLFFDDRGSGAGSTFQLGTRSGRLLRIYMKGQQLGAPASPWCRWEVQTMGTEFHLTLDHLRNPGVLLHQYPSLDHLPVDGTGDAAMRVQKEVEINLDKTADWLRVVCGPALTLIREAIGAEVTLQLIESDKTPRRWKRLGNSRKGLSDLVADALMSSRKYAPIAGTPIYTSAEQRERA